MITANPVTLNNGADHSFTFRAQIPDAKTVQSQWIEPAAALVDNSSLSYKHDEKSLTVRRRLASRRVSKPTVTRGYRPITVNLSVAYDVEHTAAQVEPELTLMAALLAAAGFKTNLLQGQI